MYIQIHVLVKAPLWLLWPGIEIAHMIRREDLQLLCVLLPLSLCFTNACANKRHLVAFTSISFWWKGGEWRERERYILMGLCGDGSGGNENGLVVGTTIKLASQQKSPEEPLKPKKRESSQVSFKWLGNFLQGRSRA